MRSNIRVPLPKGWPQTIRSAVVHAMRLRERASVDDVEFASNSVFATWAVASIFRSSS